jgi:hypothetical protein
LGLSTVLDTGISGGTGKRPDILGYVRSKDSDLVLPAEIVIESKKPHEISNYATIVDALSDGWFWTEKTVPYIRENLTRIQYFVLTTFTSFAIVTISDELRRGFIEWAPEDDESLRSAVRANTITFDLENFADRLAEFAAGKEDISSSGLFESVRTSLPASYELLEGVTRRDLHIFLMTQHPGMTQPAVETLAKEHPEEVVGEFVAASIHSLIGRLFACTNAASSTR